MANNGDDTPGTSEDHKDPELKRKADEDLSMAVVPTLQNTPLSNEEIVSPLEHEILTEQFENYLRVARTLLRTLKRPKDIEICTSLLRKVQRLNDSNKIQVKRNNNFFFRYCLRVLKWTSENQPLGLYNCLYPDNNATETITESRTWSELNKSYMALKCLKDGTNIIYMGVSEDPSAGWQDGGLNVLAKRGACFKNSRP